jgi:hypothetical protein
MNAIAAMMQRVQQIQLKLMIDGSPEGVVIMSWLGGPSLFSQGDSIDFAASDVGLKLYEKGVVLPLEYQYNVKYKLHETPLLKKWITEQWVFQTPGIFNVQ